MDTGQGHAQDNRNAELNVVIWIIWATDFPPPPYGTRHDRREI
jgi:hypothetical protein